MQVDVHSWSPTAGWRNLEVTVPRNSADLVLVFGGSGALDIEAPVRDLRRVYPAAQLVGCSTAGEIFDTQVFDDALVAAAISLDFAWVRTTRVELSDHADARAAGLALVLQLPIENLRHVLVFSDGLHVNGSLLAEGMTAALPELVSVTGGLAGDGPRFQSTQVIYNDSIRSRVAVAVGFYGDALEIGYGTLGGWDVFGPDRLITRSTGNVLFELDGQSALQLYKQYLGEYARDLPGTGLLFPLHLQLPNSAERVVRTILGVDESAQSLIFAGDVPEGSRAQLMRANFDRLVDGAVGAANACMNTNGNTKGNTWQLALLVSCVGRKMVLQQRIEEEVEGVREVLGPATAMVGFYSYGELSPLVSGAPCQLHNQTMTITTFSEPSLSGLSLTSTG